MDVAQVCEMTVLCPVCDYTESVPLTLVAGGFTVAENGYHLVGSRKCACKAILSVDLTVVARDE
jgi:hypothetical protein